MLTRDLYVKRNLNVDSLSTMADVNLSSMSASGDVTVAGNLVVNGTTTSIDSTNVLLSDRHLYLNKDQTTTTGQSGGVVVNVKATGTTTTVAGAFTTSTVITTGSAVFAAGDFIQITSADSTENNGLFEVSDHTGTTLTISTTSDFAQTAFVASAVVAGQIDKVLVSVIQSSDAGVWQTMSADNSSGVFKNILLAGDAASSATIALTADSNQIVLDSDGASPATISSAQTGGAKTFTIPDVASGDFVMTTGVQSITGVKTMTSPVLNLATLSLDDGSANGLTITPATLGADRTLTIDMSEGDRTLSLGGDLTTAGAFPLTLTQTAITSVTLPTSGTLATLAGSETLTNKRVVATVSTESDADKTVALTDSEILLFPLTANARTATLPLVADAAGYSFKFVIQSVSGGSLTVVPATGEQLEGTVDQTMVLNVVNQVLSVVSDGTSWRIA